MAQRRMFSKRIIQSSRFLKMPSSTRLLYYDLGMAADDDGIVEAFTVLRMTGASEDDLRVLHAKGFVKVINDDELITYITDWTENNKIRSDRKIDSIYKDLLLQICPEVELLESKERSDRKKIGTSQGHTNDSIGKDSTGQERTVQVREGKTSISKGEFENYGSSNEMNNLKLYEILGFGTVNSVTSADIEVLEEEYTAKWVEEALKEANYQGTRTMKYVRGILKNWKVTGITKEKDKTKESKPSNKPTNERYNSQMYEEYKPSDEPYDYEKVYRETCERMRKKKQEEQNKK